VLFQIIKKYGLLYVTLLLLVSANNNCKWKKGALPAKTTTNLNAVDTTSESFNIFFNRFSTDSVFQISRIAFPIKLTKIGGEVESDTTKFIEKRLVD